MALEQIKNHFGEGGAFLAGSGPGRLKNILTELQGLSIALVAGANPTKNTWTLNLSGTTPTETDVHTVVVDGVSNSKTVANGEDIDDVGAALAVLLVADGIAATYSDVTHILTITGPDTGESVTVTYAGLDAAAAPIATAGVLTETVEGAVASIEVAGMSDEDTVAFVLGLDPDNGTPANQVVDFTDDFSIASDGSLVSEALTSGYDLVVIWYDKQ